MTDGSARIDQHAGQERGVDDDVHVEERSVVLAAPIDADPLDDRSMVPCSQDWSSLLLDSIEELTQRADRFIGHVVRQGIVHSLTLAQTRLRRAIHSDRIVDVDVDKAPPTSLNSPPLRRHRPHDHGCWSKRSGRPG